MKLMKRYPAIWIGLGAAALVVLAAVGCASLPRTSTLTSVPGGATGGMMGGGTSGTTGMNGGATGGMTGGGTSSMPGGTAGTTTMPGTATPASAASISNGRSIYLYATSDSGSSVTYTDGPNTMMGGRLSCATCHGANGYGGTFYVMMGSYHAPNITWPVLSGPDPDMQHPPYTVTTLQRAITEGIDPGGSPLDYPMPHWQMSQSDLNDLIAYLMTLK